MARPAHTETAPFPDVVEQAAELAALLRLLVISVGTFSLGTAICNSPALRNYLVGRVKETHPQLAIAPLRAGCVDVYGEVVHQLAGEKPSAVFVTGIENSVSSSSVAQPTLRSLNASRDLWESHFACPVVFWVPSYVETLLSRHAPDFWRYQSHRFEFVAETNDFKILSTEQFAGDITLAGNLDADQKQFRIAQLEQRLADAGDPPPMSLLPHVLVWMNELAFLHQQIGNLQAAEQWLQRSFDYNTRLQRPEGEATALSNLGILARRRGELEKAGRFLRDALKRQVEARDLPGQGLVEVNLGLLAKEQDRHEEALLLFRQALQKFLDTQDLQGQSIALGSLGQIEREMGNYEEAERLLKESLAIERQLGRLEGQAVDLGSLGGIAFDRGDLVKAEALCHEALQIYQRLGIPEEQANCLSNLGEIAREKGEPSKVRSYWSEAQDLYTRAGLPQKAEKVSHWLADSSPESS